MLNLSSSLQSLSSLTLNYLSLKHLLTVTVVTATATILLTSCSATVSSSSKKSIAVTQIVEHPSLNAIRDGLKEELIASGYDPEKNLKWQWTTAQGNPSTAAQIAKKYAGENPDAIVAISTPSAQTAIAAAPKLPVIFSGVTDPLGAKLVPNLQFPGGLITGVSDLAPLGKHLELIHQITPKAKRIGVMYNSGESNSVTQVNLLKAAAATHGMTIVEVTVTNSSEVATAAKSLVGKVDSIYVPTDNTIVSALEAVLQVGITHKLPIYAGDTDSVDRGAIATLGFNYKDVGKQTGKMVVRILKGEKPGSIAVETPSQLNLVINKTAAQQMGVTVPEAVLKTAQKVIP
jgi:putative tryptophan/tyrosine transport system substrate-binding protein